MIFLNFDYFFFVRTKCRIKYIYLRNLLDNFSAGPYLYSLIRPSFIHMYILVTPDFKLWGSLSCQRQPWQWNNLITVYDTCLCNIWTWCKKGNNSNCQPSNLSPVSLKCIPSLKLLVLHRTKKKPHNPPPKKKKLYYIILSVHLSLGYIVLHLFTHVIVNHWKYEE